ncbi:ABC transporter [Egibacter rhizosphaerae]|uniref:Transport permease protein n=1 Tax=Egibacter rhizosphaerae TaxID=1670831 RepID=A0A411YER7_9ACTN|nr:ABC transporter permease [Egibacter rhizosphaerae]QBI19753.1 ABC transporter [Egibacter rhizosphaerae]
MSAWLVHTLKLREGGGRHVPLVLERNAMFYRRFWPVILTGFFEPVFYLLAMGLGLGALVPAVEGPDGRAVEYLAFVAPALLAVSAMNGAVFESTVNTWVKLRFWKTFDAMLATPLRPLDIAIGEVTWSQLRGLMYAGAFLAMAAALGGIPSWWALAALPAAMLVGFAFSALGTTVATWIRDWQDQELVQVVILPMMLLSATFFPIDVYPEAVQPLVWLSPLFHGAALLRGLTLGVLEPVLLVHAGVLVVLTLLAGVVAARRFERLLKP